MTDPDFSPTNTLARLLAIGAVVVGMLVVVIVVTSVVFEREEPRIHPPVTSLDVPPPIASEAEVFRMDREVRAVAWDAPRRPAAHPRNLATFRRLRAYPGAPPRVPHGLTDAEFRETRCNHCHASGGYSPRFGAYAPVTPHPEWSGCLQCHAADASIVGVELPPPGAPAAEQARCGQCHIDPDAPSPRLVSVNWSSESWPELDQRAMEGAPPAIPHDVELRGNCVACHAGPAAVEEIRTTHPERTDCRQCHVLVEEAAGGAVGTQGFHRPGAAEGDR